LVWHSQKCHRISMPGLRGVRCIGVASIRQTRVRIGYHQGSQVGQE